MSPKRAEQLSLDLQSQSLAVAQAAQEAQGDLQVKLEEGSRSLAQAAKRLTARSLANEAPILELDASATMATIRAARTRRAVRRGRDVYLPSWADYAVGLPNALLRSALWSASDSVDCWLDGAEIAALGQDVRVLYSGRQLTQYDRRVFATCLEYYVDRPLSTNAASPWVCVSFYQFAQAMGLAYTLNSHKALRASLIRLEAAALRVTVGQLELPVPRLVEVAFADGYHVRDAEELKGSDQISFRVLEEFASLYGPTSWTAVPKPALEHKGLRAWLCGFYATHSEPRPLPFTKLHQLSGLACRANDFRTRVLAALEELRSLDTPEALRVSSYHVSEDKKFLTVRLASW